MPAVHVRDVPEPVLAALRERAERHGRSMQEEIRQILASAAGEGLPGETVAPIALITVRTAGTSAWNREEIYGEQGR